VNSGVSTVVQVNKPWIFSFGRAATIGARPITKLGVEKGDKKTKDAGHKKITGRGDQVSCKTPLRI
jgi:hypothetical protein